jgi:tRNA nucleotidyltransferase (CCA-adding enzyme)
MTADVYLYTILAREAVDTGPQSPIRAAQAILTQLIREWASNKLLSFHPSGSFMKGTAVFSGTDIDLFISLSEETVESLRDIHALLIDIISEARLMDMPKAALS